MRHETFHYPTVQALKEEIDTLGVFMPLKEELSVLFTPQQVGSRTAANRIAFEPMEGTDGTADGAPGELTRRRYLRFAEAGPGLIWFEAVATLPEVRASAHQLWLTRDNVDAFRRLLDEIRETSLRRCR